MNKNILNFIFLIIVLVFLAVPIFHFSLLDQAQEKENEALLKQKQALEELRQRNYLMGKFEPSAKDDFAVVSAEYNVAGYKMYLRKETLDAFTKMAKSAEKEGIELNIASSTRNFDYQKDLWNKKWTGITLVDKKNLLNTIPDELERFRKILEYSAVPGTSRHHWGTDIDINAATPEYFRTGEGIKVYEWLIKNASAFGFCQTYNLKGSIRPNGYYEEKWHWSYFPLSKNFTEEYKNLIKEEDINGFLGDEYVAGQDLINDYVLSINPECL